MLVAAANPRRGHANEERPEHPRSNMRWVMSGGGGRDEGRSMLHPVDDTAMNVHDRTLWCSRLRPPRGRSQRRTIWSRVLPPLPPPTHAIEVGKVGFLSGVGLHGGQAWRPL